MMKIKIDKARVFVKAKFKSEGSVLRETIQAEGLGFETRVEVNSGERPEHIAAVLRNAESGCYVLQSIRNPVPVDSTFALNGTELNPESFSKTR